MLDLNASPTDANSQQEVVDGSVWCRACGGGQRTEPLTSCSRDVRLMKRRKSSPPEDTATEESTPVRQSVADVRFSLRPRIVSPGEVRDRCSLSNWAVDDRGCCDLRCERRAVSTNLYLSWEIRAECVWQLRPRPCRGLRSSAPWSTPPALSKRTWLIAAILRPHMEISGKTWADLPSSFILKATIESQS